MEAKPNAHGDLEVVERVRLATPTRDLVIGPPSSRGVAGNAATLKPSVNDLQVSVDGEIGNVLMGSAAITESRRVQLTREAHTLILRYRIEGAVWRSVPGPPGRALALLPPITSAPRGSSLPVVVKVGGAEVRNLLCPALDRAHQLCGRSDGSAWATTEFAAGTTAVVAQLDLPSPGA